MNRFVRVALLALAAVALVALLFLVVFPWVDRTFVTDPVVGGVVLAAPPAASGRQARGRSPDGPVGS